MINNLPIYRAKTKCNKEYVEGFLTPYISQDGEIWEDMGLVICHKIEECDDYFWWKKSEIDETTLSIHFPDMIDSQGNKIFASLQEDGKGGDIVEYKGRQYTFGYKKEYFKVGLLFFRGWQLTTSDLLKVKTIGIQE